MKHSGSDYPSFSSVCRVKPAKPQQKPDPSEPAQRTSDNMRTRYPIPNTRRSKENTRRGDTDRNQTKDSAMTPTPSQCPGIIPERKNRKMCPSGNSMPENHRNQDVDTLKDIIDGAEMCVCEVVRPSRMLVQPPVPVSTPICRPPDRTPTPFPWHCMRYSECREQVEAGIARVPPFRGKKPPRPRFGIGNQEGRKRHEASRQRFRLR